MHVPGFTSNLGPLAREIARVPALFRRIFRWQERRFFSRRRDAEHYTPLFARQFSGPQSSLVALQSLTADLVPAVAANAGRMPELAAAPFPVRLIWGARDPDLNLGVAEDLRRKLPRAQLDVLPRARHNLQIDEPGRVAGLITRRAH